MDSRSTHSINFKFDYINVHTVSLVVPRVGPEGTVDRDLVPVRPEPVSVGVVVREKTTLQHLVRTEIFWIESACRNVLGGTSAQYQAPGERD